MKHLTWMACASLTWATSAQAQPQGDYERLQAQAQVAFDRGQPAEALALAERAARIRMEPRLRRFIAVMHYELGPEHLPAAVENADLCVRESQASEDPDDRRDTLGVCQRMAAELGAQVGRVVIRVPSPTPRGLHVRLQGAELDASRWGAPVPVLPGAVRVEALSGGDVIVRREFQLTAGGREVVVVPAPTPAPPTPARSSPSPSPSPSPVPWIVAGAGAALLIAGNVFIVVRDDLRHERDDLCPGSVCPTTIAHDQAYERDGAARSWQTAAYVTAGVGAATLVGSLVWGVVNLRRERPTHAAWSPSLRATSEGAALGMSVRF